MNRFVYSSCSFTAAALLAAAPLALAGAQQNAPGQNSMYQRNEQSSSTQSRSAEANSRSATVAAPPQADIQPFEQAKLSLTQAIDRAKEKQEGKVLEARFEVWNGKPVYFIRSSANDQLWEGRIDANTGDLVGQPRTMSAAQLTSTLKRDVKTLGMTQTGLDQAVDNAQSQKGGKAIMAVLQPEHRGTPAYDLYLVNNGQIQTAMVNAKTGQVM